MQKSYLRPPPRGRIRRPAGLGLLRARVWPAGRAGPASPGRTGPGQASRAGRPLQAGPGQASPGRASPARPGPGSWGDLATRKGEACDNIVRFSYGAGLYGHNVKITASAKINKSNTHKENTKLICVCLKAPTCHIYCIFCVVVFFSPQGQKS